MEAELIKERELREKLMNETSQMRVQLENYDKELNEVNHSMSTANRVLNVVLVILILVMLAIGGMLLYWIMQDRGIL